MAVNSQREDIPRISAESLDDWQRIKRNYTLAALNALDEQLKASNGTPEDRQVLLAHVHQVPLSVPRHANEDAVTHTRVDISST